MIAIIFKAILSSGLFLLAYKLLLEREKMHQFNRFYLLFSLVLSFVIPFLTIKIFVPVSIPIHNVLISPEQMDPQGYPSQLVSIAETNNWPSILWIVYGLITTILLARFVINLKAIFDKVRLAAIIPYRNSKLVLTDEELVPYSFLNYIFVNTDDFSRGNIEEEILLHELTHARQKHTVDVLFIELASVMLWFNPFLILYRRVIQLNHEFLADEKVIHSNHDVPAYQHLLVSKSRGQSNSVFTSPFNYLITKKRLIMMTRTTSNRVALAKQVASFLLFICTILFLSTKTYAQTKANPVVTPSSPGKSHSIQDSTKLSSPPENSNGQDYKRIEFVSEIPKSYRILGEDDKYLYLSNSGKYYKMVKTHTDEKPLAKNPPTEDQLKKWSDAGKYGVWLDGKKVMNAVLSNYVSTDFARYFESRLMANAKINVNYDYQVNLTTNEAYERYLKNWVATKSYVPDPGKTWELLVRGGSWNDVKDKLK